MIKPKYGKCIDCPESDPDKPLIAKRCHYHYQRYRQTQWKKKNVLEKPKTRIKYKSDKQVLRDRKYSKIRAVWIVEHSVCEMQIDSNCSYKATDVHHMKGKIGELFFDTKYFKAGCRSCHDYVEANPKEAKESGFSLDRLSATN